MAFSNYEDWPTPFSDYSVERRKTAKAFRKGRDVLLEDGFGGFFNSVFYLFCRKKSEFALAIEPNQDEAEYTSFSIEGTYNIAYRKMKGKPDMLKEVSDGKLDVLLITADMVNDADLRAALKEHPPKHVIVNHAENLIDTESEYYKKYQQIPKLIRFFPERPAVLACVPTLAKEDRARICLDLEMRGWKTCKAALEVPDYD